MFARPFVFRRLAPGPQAGFMLVELTLAVALASLVLVWASSKVARDIDDAAARSTGAWLFEIKRGLDQMLLHFDSLAAGTVPLSSAGKPLYANALAPRLGELKTHGHLAAGFPETSVLGMGARVRILRDARCPGVGCRLDALAYGEAPVADASGVPDLMRIAAALEAAGGYGGSSTSHAASRVRGANFNFPNPLAAGQRKLAPGTLAVWASVSGADHDRFVRLRDTRDPDLRGNLSVYGQVAARGRLHTQEYLSLGASAIKGAACGSDRSLVSRSDRGRLLSCSEGVWTEADSGFGGAYAVNNKFGCAHYWGVSTANPRTGKCTCPAGFTAVIVSAGGKWTETEGWTTGYVCVR